MPKGDSPEITAFVPPSQDCPTVALRKIKIDELDDPCARSVVADILIEKLGNTAWTIDFFTTPVRLEIQRKNRPPKVYEWNPSDFQCLQEYLDNLRSRLPEFDTSQFSEIVEINMASIIQQVRDSCVRRRVETVEVPRVPSEADLVIQRIRFTLGLEGLRAPSRRLENLRRTDLRRIPRDQHGVVQLARWVSQLEEIKKVILG